MDFDPVNAVHIAETYCDSKEYDKAMQLFVKAAFSLIFNSDHNSSAQSAMKKTIHCYGLMNPKFSVDHNLDYIRQYFAVVRHWQDHRKFSLKEIQQEIYREIPFPSADDSREEMPAGATHSTQINSDGFDVAVAAGQGIRDEMEDAFIAEHFSIENGERINADLFCVFDGHGGKTCAQYIAEELPKRLRNRLDQLEEFSDKHIYEALIDTCVEIDESWKKLPLQIEGWKDASGSTALIALYLNQKELWVANVGDSGAVIELSGKAIQLTESAKPANPKYYQEIYMRGGIISYGRVDATLDMARAIGDLSHPSVSARPTVKKIEISNPHHALILACDGLWDVLEGQVALECIRGKPAIEAAELLRTLAYQRGSTDNVSIIVAMPKKINK